MDGKLKIRRKGVFKLDVHSGFYSFLDQNFCSKKACAHYINESSTGSVSTMLFAAKFSYTSKQLPNKLVFQKKFNNFLLWNLKKYPHTIFLFPSPRLSHTKLTVRVFGETCNFRNFFIWFKIFLEWNHWKLKQNCWKIFERRLRIRFC